MTTATRYVEFEFTCPNGHVNHREQMAVGALDESAAIRSVLAQEIKCDKCEAPLQQGNNSSFLSAET